MRTLKLTAVGSCRLLVCRDHFRSTGGRQIVVTAEMPSYGRRTTTTGTVPKGNILVVKNVNGDWFWVIFSTGHESVKGWINRSDVIPFSQALDFFNDELKRKPIASAYIIRGMIWDEKGEYDLAIGDFNEAIRLDPNYKWAYHNRGLAWSDKEYDNAFSISTRPFGSIPKSHLPITIVACYGSQKGI